MPAGAILATAWRRENLRGRLSSAPSIEETGLDAVLYGERQPFREEELSAYARAGRNGSIRDGETFQDALAAVHGENGVTTGVKRVKQVRDANEGDGIRLERGQSAPLQVGTENALRLKKQGSGFGGRMDSTGKKHSGETFAEVWERLSSASKKSEVPPEEVASLDSGPSPDAEPKEEKALPTLRGLSGTYRSGSVKRTSSSHLKLERLSGIEEGDLGDESAASSPRNGDEHPFTGSGTLPSPGGSMRLLRSSSGARNRWRRLRHTVQFASHMTQLRYVAILIVSAYFIELGFRH